jgi:hypothetical protein
MFQDIYLRIQWLKINRTKYHLEELDALLGQIFTSKSAGLSDMLRIDLLYCLGKNYRWWHLSLFYEVVVDYLHQRFHIPREESELGCDELFEFLLEHSLQQPLSDRDFIFYMLLAQDKQEFGFDVDNSILLRSSRISQELVLKCMMELDEQIHKQADFKMLKRMDYLMGNYQADISSESIADYMNDLGGFLKEKTRSKKELDPKRLAVLLSHRLVERAAAHSYELTPYARKLFDSEAT